MHNNKHNDNGALGKTIVGLGAAAALVGTYLLYGSKKGPARRAKVQGWMFKMKGEVLDEIENLKEVSEDVYYKIVDEVKDKNKKMKNVSQDEVEDVASEIKEGWDDVGKSGEKHQRRRSILEA